VIKQFDCGIYRLQMKESKSINIPHFWVIASLCIAAVFSPFGNWLATCSRDGYVILWDPQTGRIIDTLKHPSEAGIRVCTFSSNSSYLATGCEDDTLVVWEMSTKSILRTYSGHDASVTACSFTPDSKFIVSGSTNGDLRLWDVQTQDSGLHIAYECDGHDLGVNGCEFSPCPPVKADNGSSTMQYLLATCGNDDVVRLFNVVVGSNYAFVLDAELRSHNTNINCCRFSPNGKLLASASGDKTVIVWNVSTRTIMMTLRGHQRFVTSCAFSTCNNYLASGSNDKTILVWKIGNNLVPNQSPTSVVVEPKTVIITPPDDSDTPSEYFCPITHEVMQEPVIVAGESIL